MTGYVDPQDAGYRPPPYITVLSARVPVLVAGLLVSAMMEAGEDPLGEHLYRVRKMQVALCAGEVAPGEVAPGEAERCAAAASPWPAFAYEQAQSCKSAQHDDREGEGN